MPKISSLERCEKALERLLSGQPHISDHVGVKYEDITPAMVSIEAGFDKGYLKRSREYHLPLIARIDALKRGAGFSTSTANKKKLERAKALAEKRRLEVDRLSEVMDKVLTQNLMLVERVRDLEKELTRYKFRMRQ